MKPLVCLLLMVGCTLYRTMAFSLFNTTSLADPKTVANEGTLDSTLALMKSKFMDLFSTAEYMSEVIPPASALVPYNMLMDVKETDTCLEMIVDLPGVEKKDINIHIDKNHLTINAEREAYSSEDRGDFKKSERFSGRISRSVHVPDDIDQTRIHAESQNGVLRVTMPKVQSGISVAKDVKVQ